MTYSPGGVLYSFYCNGGQCLTVYNCATYCKNTARCLAFTYVNGMCYLMSAETPLTAMAGSTAGRVTMSNINNTPYAGMVCQLYWVVETTCILACQATYAERVKKMYCIVPGINAPSQQHQAAASCVAAADISCQGCVLQIRATQHAGQRSQSLRMETIMATTSKDHPSITPPRLMSASMLAISDQSAQHSLIYREDAGSNMQVASSRHTAAM